MEINPFDDDSGENEFEAFDDFEEMDLLQSNISFDVEELEQTAQTDEAGALDGFLARLTPKLKTFAGLWSGLSRAVETAKEKFKGYLWFREKELTDLEEAERSGLLIDDATKEALLASGTYSERGQLFAKFKDVLAYITDAGLVEYSYIFYDGWSFGVIVQEKSGYGNNRGIRDDASLVF